MSTRFPYSPGRTPPIPAVALASPDATRSIPGVPAHLDTAADISVVPEPLLLQLGLQPLGPVVGRGLGGVAQRMSLFRVSIEIPSVAVVAAHPHEQFVLIGRDVLNLFRITIDGPNQFVEFH